jgi:hypothetical protein
VQVEGTGDVVISLEEEKNTVHHYKISKVFPIEIITTTEENTGSFLPPPYQWLQSQTRNRRIWCDGSWIFLYMFYSSKHLLRPFTFECKGPFLPFPFPTFFSLSRAAMRRRLRICP